MLGSVLRILTIVFALLPFSPALTEAAPRAEAWPRWERHDPASKIVVDHSAWDGFLADNVSVSPDGINRLAYGRVSAESRSRLASYIERLAAVPVDRLARDEQRAFWINLYNALTVKTVLDHYPVKSIRDIRISPGLFSSGPWGRKLIRVAGEDISLDDIEHRILRPLWRDPRLHYALNCASLGCPNLMRTAFTASNTETLLEEAARGFVGHPRGVHLQGGKLIVSSIYIWFREDFGGSDTGIVEHLKRYGAVLDGRTRIDGDAYDWALNEAP
ncbi:MAG: DUF547 domain-containing protein [Alphaproteobacteria bacterium]|nr:DUF547 domain-containing protein [Alphaproteobacteria bacterium]